ncbi:MAG: hypothetical protein LIO95_09925 [Clostridiales bacterium]|nr:hypothetical protein [Clostridiales bacterium]
MLYTHAQLCALAMAGKSPPFWEAFNLWNDEEITGFKEARLRRMLEGKGAGR